MRAVCSQLAAGSGTQKDVVPGAFSVLVLIKWETGRREKWPGNDGRVGAGSILNGGGRGGWNILNEGGRVWGI